MIHKNIKQLVKYGLKNHLLEKEDEIFTINQLLELFQLDEMEDVEAPEAELENILKEMLDYAAANGLMEDDITHRDLFDTKIMSKLLPRPSEVIRTFWKLYKEESPKAATDYYYKFSQDTDYIRRYRIKKDRKWKVDSPYGEIDITSAVNKGTCVVITLPLNLQGECKKCGDQCKWIDTKAKVAADEPVNLTGRKILVAEDNEINMEIVTELLQMKGLEVIQAWNGREAVEAFEKSAEWEISMILMDMQMPEMDGCEASLAIRSLDRADATKVPIIAVTANAFAEDISATMAAGMNAHISKPISFKALEKLAEMIACQHGDASVINDYSLMGEASNEIELVYLEKDTCYVDHIDALMIGEAAMNLGAGRAEIADKIDHTVGIVLNKKVGDKVSHGDVIATIYANELGIEVASKMILDAYTMSKEKILNRDVIIKVVR